MFEAIEHEFSSQTPRYRNAEGNVPFAPMTNFSSRVEAYWQLVDYIISGANQRGIVCIVHPAYLGFGGGSQGWTAEVLAETNANLQNYGAWLANRYNGQGVIWCLGGDYAGGQHPGLLAKQWNIAQGIRSVDAAAVITAHGARTESAYSKWSSFSGLNLNNIYSDGVEYTHAAVEYARPGPLPFFLIEGYYDGESASAADCRRQAYASVLSGACGHLFGNNPIWGFGEPNFNGGAGAAAALNSSLSTTATQQMRHVKTLFSAHSWWKLEPRTGTQLVTTGLGSGAGRICPALANDGSFAMIWTTGSNFTVNMTALAPASVRARWFDTINGTYSAVVGSPFSNAGARAFTSPGERVLVLDAA
jgi:hypothetical protein